ncbi:hypothetical protein IEI94_07480 [Halomonas sp. ML-15]|uniref:hypothetical protein n=1 Tax=Halomonas sp. ML-15 TaxID=2773305 RepID=UPI001747816C|nr:hypothetical protein [Halomonas sp. ML-15]MBD3895692.1 hypothetical protein [Halomonas sp. ML-15]
MKRTTLITTTLIAGILTLGMASQTTAAELTQVRFEVGSPLLGGTREGTHEFRVPIDEQAAQSGDHMDYRISLEVGSPMLGGTREGIHRERVKFEGPQLSAQQASSPEYGGPRVDRPRQGTRG